MFVVFLEFSKGKREAAVHMAAHNAWIERGFEEGVFALVGSLLPSLGGALIVRNTTRAELEARLGEDPFVVYGVVRAEVFELSPSRADPRLSFLRDEGLG